MNNNKDIELDPILIDDKWGYADEAGNIVIPCQWLSAGNFSEGLAPVASEEGYGYIDKTGKLVIPYHPDWTDAWEFEDGVAIIYDNNYEEHVIDKSGNIVKNPEEDAELSYNEGYELAQTEYDKLAIKPASSEEWVDFFNNILLGRSGLFGFCGAAAFITFEEIRNLNLKQFNKELNALGKLSRQHAIDARIIDSLLPFPEDDYEGMHVDIPADLRPDYTTSSPFGSATGKLGSIYLKEVGMHMYLPHCDIYDPDDPDELVCADMQFDASGVKLSGLLSVLQSLIDPNKENKELTETILRCQQYEDTPSTLPALLKKYGIGVIDLSRNGWHRVNYAAIHAEALYVELDEQDHLQVTLQPEMWGWDDDSDNPFDATEAGFGELSDFIKEALNRARNTQRVK